jgi:hypothetical protein
MLLLFIGADPPRSKYGSSKSMSEEMMDKKSTDGIVMSLFLGIIDLA